MTTATETKTYRGYRGPHVACVEVMHDDGDYPLPMRLDLMNHSPSGFEWGYCGSGPAQLALALLADCLGDDVAQTCYQSFKAERIAVLNREWVMTEEDIRNWYAMHLAMLAREMETT